MKSNYKDNKKFNHWQNVILKLQEEIKLLKFDLKEERKKNNYVSKLLHERHNSLSSIKEELRLFKIDKKMDHIFKASYYAREYKDE